MNIKGLIFDVLGTLVDDSGFPRERIWKLMQKDGICPERAEYYRLYDYLTKSIFNWAAIDEFISIRELYRRRLKFFYDKYGVSRDIEADLNYLWQCMGESQIYPEVPEVLNKLKSGYKLGLLSNADEDDPLIAKLLSSGFQFDAIVTSESLKAYKPRPQVFEKVLHDLHLKKDEALLIGDSQLSDIRGGKAAGMQVVWVNRRKENLQEDVPPPDFEVQNLRQLLEILPNAAQQRQICVQ